MRLRLTQHDLVDPPHRRCLGLREQLLVQLLSRPDTREHDLDVLVRTLPRHPDHVLGQLHDPHRLSHVQHTQIAILGHRPTVQHQTGRLRNTHEVPRHLRIRHRHRSARLDLLLEKRHHTPSAAQHIPEPHRRERRRLSARQILDHHLRHPLRHSHDAAGIHRLVRRNEHELAHPTFARHLSHSQRPQHIVAHGLFRILLHERHVLVGSGVEDYLRAVVADHVPHLPAVHHVTYDPHQVQLGMSRSQLLLNQVDRALSLAQQQQLARRALTDLPAQLRPNRSPRSRHQHYSVA